ncbi:MAG: hypothetical protein CBB67_008595 [Alteromonadaceae bacterium TMED7]|nr:hypothetical protein [Alteromonadaceae bacterium]MCP4057627.1 hypothetical protein [Pseudoalteromonas sp.]RPH19621.1 MAG: hypothetical protein CBB67_008595 [Alteromonadaceae bacterium TMED7]|tara:strand:+ start:708 stop:1412 length:705 start_codon:yes stop_codon:yes gene_type:complete
MKKFTQESEEITLVILGSFNPTIFQPQWLIRNQLVAEEELSGDNINIELIHRDLTKFENNWFIIEVTPSRLLIKAKKSHRSEAVRDLICSIFAILSETPIESFGMNYIEEYRCASSSDWHAFGDTLTPKEIWHQAISTDESTKSIGMLQTEMRVERFDSLPGNINVKVAPSNFDPPKFKVHINDHIDYATLLKDTSSSMETAFPQFLMSFWEDSIDNSKHYIANLVQLVEERIS